jgi:pimeloyl-ACP methyl ester carboxylesterase
MRLTHFVALVGGVLVLLLAGTIALNWAPDRPVSALVGRWAAPPSVFVDVAGQRTHLRDEGPRTDPLPLVLLHGTSASLHTWDGWAQALSSERRVIRVDLPGFGLTGPALNDDYRIEHYVEFVVALLDTLGVQHCVLAGNSFGGWIAWETALALPERVRALVLVDAAGYPLDSESVPLGFRIARVPGLNRLMESVLPRSMIESSLRNVYGDPSRVTPALVDRYYELTLREGNRAALARRFAAGRHAADTSRVAQLHVPTLILWGELDRLIPPAHAAHFERDIPGSRRVMFPGLGHVPHEEDPAATVSVVREFLAQIDAAAASQP